MIYCITFRYRPTFKSFFFFTKLREGSPLSQGGAVSASAVEGPFQKESSISCRNIGKAVSTFAVPQCVFLQLMTLYLKSHF